MRQLASHVNSTLGSKQGNKHAEADLTDDIDELMGNLSHNKVYRVQLGRAFAADDAPRVPDVFSKGQDALIWGASSPLSAFNAKFDALKKRRGIRPLVPTATNPITAPGSVPPSTLEPSQAVTEAQGGQRMSTPMLLWFSNPTNEVLASQAATDENDSDLEEDAVSDYGDENDFELPVVDAADLELTADAYWGVEDDLFEDDDDDDDWIDE